MSVIAAARELAALAQFADGLDDLTGIADFLDVPMGDWFDVPPDQASDYFSRKGLRTTWSYADMLGQEHDRAFTVAKMMDVDMLGQVRDSLQSALANGVTFRDWSATLTPILKQAGWWGEVDGAKLGSPWRLETIFRTNMLTAYAVGQWGQIVSQADIAPYLMYDAVDDHRTRPLHHAWDGTVLPVLHPWWRQHMPPNGHNCRCGTIQLDADQLADMGLSASEPPEDGTYRWINPRTGRARDVPNGIDPGFDRNAGADVVQAAERDKIKPGATVPEVAKTLAQRVRQMPAESRAAVSQSMAREHWSRFDALALAFVAGSAEARLAAAVAAYRTRFGDAPPLVPGLSVLELVELFQAAVARGVALPPEFGWS